MTLADLHIRANRIIAEHGARSLVTRAALVSSRERIARAQAEVEQDAADALEIQEQLARAREALLRRKPLV